MPLLGTEEVRRVQAQLDDAPRVMASEIADRMRPALGRLEVDVPATARRYMPHRGGYAAVLAESTRVDVRVTKRQSKVTGTVRVSAKGRRKMRDVRARNLGLLRHPTWGRRGEGDWHDQVVRRGFVDDPMRRADRRVQKGIHDALDELTRRLSGG